MEIIRGMYGLPQEAILENNLLVHCLHNHGYYQVKLTPVLWVHVWRHISFTLVLEYFGIGYVVREHAYHLMSSLKMYCEKITTDWEVKLYCGIAMKCNYTKRYIYISMPGYLKEALHQFGHNTSIKPYHQPYSEL